MKAIIQTAYGPPDEVLELRDIDKPVIGDDEVLVRVRAASLHPDVWHTVRGVPYVLRIMGAGLREPKNRVPGTDVAGHVEVVGTNVTRFRPGVEVFGEIVKGNQWRNGGAYAEYAAAPEAALGLKPANITFVQAAAVPTSALIAHRALLGEGRIRPGQNVVINGAGGGVGTFAVQIAKAYGADVTAVDSAEKLDMLRSIGADRVIDYTRETSPGVASAMTSSSTSRRTVRGRIANARSPRRGRTCSSGTTISGLRTTDGSEVWVASSDCSCCHCSTSGSRACGRSRIRKATPWPS